MKKTSFLLLFILCVSSIGIVSAVTPQVIDFVSQVVLIILPSTSIVQPTTPSLIPTTSISTNTNQITPSSSALSFTVSTGVQSTAGAQTSTPTKATGSVSPTTNTLAAQTGTSRSSSGMVTVSSTVTPTTSLASVSTGGVPKGGLIPLSSSVSPTTSILQIFDPSTSGTTQTSFTPQSTTISPSVTSGSVQSVIPVTTTLSLIGTLTTSSSSSTPSSTTIAPSSSTATVSTSSSTPSTGILSKTSSSISSNNIVSSSTSSLTRTSSSISSTSYTPTPSTSTPATNAGSLSRTLSSVTPSTATLTRTIGSIGATNVNTGSGSFTTTITRTSSSISSSQYTLGGTSTSSNSITLSSITGSISGSSKGSGSSTPGTLSKTSGSIFGTTIDLSGDVAPGIGLVKTISSITGTQSGPVVVTTLTKTTGSIPGCPVDEICTSESLSITATGVAYKIIDGPVFKSIILSDIDGDGTISDGDIITLSFNIDTNKPTVTTKSNVNDLLSFSQPLGLSYSGVWQTPSKLIITLDDTTGIQISEIGTSTITVLDDNVTLKNAQQTSLSSTDRGFIIGELGTKVGPAIISFVANDPDSSDDILSNGDTLTIKFDQPTDRGGFTGTLSKTDILSLFSFFTGSNSISPGNNYSGEWTSNSTFVMTLEDTLLSSLTIRTDSDAGTTTTVTGSIKDSTGISKDSDSVSPELSGTFGTFSTTNVVIDGGSVSTDLPSGTTAEIQLPEGDSGKITISTAEADLEGDSFSISAIGDVVEFDPTNGASCIDGCTISFSFTSDEVPIGFDPLNMKILHDGNDDGDFDDTGEQLDTTVVEITPGLYIATADSNFTSKFAVGGVKALALGGLSGGGKNPNYPSIDSASMISYGISSDGIGGKFTPIDLDLIEDILVFKTNEDLRFSFNMFENQGINNIEHIGLYLNNYGPELKIKDYDTSIVYDKYSPEELTLSDPNGLIEYYDFEIVEIDAVNFKINFDLTFSKPIDETNFYVTFWDLDRNVGYKTFENILQISDSINQSGVQMDPEPVSESEVIEKQIYVPNWVKSTAKWWSVEEITDEEFVKTVKFLIQEKIIIISETQSGTNSISKIPDWVRINAEWWAYDSISNNEFVNSITYLVQKNIIRI